MAIGRYGGYQADCDKCGETIVFESESGYSTMQEIKETLREVGWSVGKQVLCPECRRKRGVKC